MSHQRDEFLTVSAKIKKSLKCELETESILHGFGSLNTLLCHLIEHRYRLYPKVATLKDSTTTLVSTSPSPQERIQPQEPSHEDSPKPTFEQFCHDSFMQGHYDYGFTKGMPPHSINVLGKPPVDQRFTNVNPEVNLPVNHEISPHIPQAGDSTLYTSTQTPSTSLPHQQQEAVYWRNRYEELSTIQAQQASYYAMLENAITTLESTIKALEYVFGIAAQLANEPHLLPRHYSVEYFAKLLEEYDGTSSC